jgi:hypothetical protein
VINYKKPVKVYRNLRHGKKARPLYSIVQNGRVVSRRHRVLLGNVKFIVNQAGREKVIREGRKNVHAFAVGLLATQGCCGIDYNGRDLGTKVTYNPYKNAHFTTFLGNRINGAMCALLNENGISVAYTY